jgi:O-antigen/teichoic acid export membrane protein
MRAETRHSLTLVFGTGFTAVLSFVYIIYATRTLGTKHAADFITAVSLVFLVTTAIGPINGAVAKFTAQYLAENNPGKVRALEKAMTRRVVLYGLVLTAVALLFVNPLAALLKFHSSTPLVISCAMAYLTLILSVSRGLLRGAQSFHQYNANILVESGFRLLIGVAILAAWTNTTASLVPYLVSLAAVLILSQFQLRELLNRAPGQPVDVAAFKSFLIPMCLMMFASAGYQNLDLLFVKYYFSNEDAGFYGAANNLARSIGVIVTPFNTLLLPLLTSMGRGSPQATGAFVRVSTYFLILCAVPLGMFYFYPDIAALAYKEDFAPAGELLVPLTIVRIFGFASALVALACVAIGRYRFLPIYLAGLALQTIALILWHDAFTDVLQTLAIAQSAVLLALIVYFIYASKRAP